MASLSIVGRQVLSLSQLGSVLLGTLYSVDGPGEAARGPAAAPVGDADAGAAEYRNGLTRVFDKNGCCKCASVAFAVSAEMMIPTKFDSAEH